MAAQRLHDLVADGSHIVLACEQSAEGVLSAVGVSYLAHVSPDTIRLMPNGYLQPMVGEAVLDISTDTDFALRVWRGFERACTYNGICLHRFMLACASDESSMPEAAHRYLRCGFEHGADLAFMLADPCVAPLVKLATFVSNECERTRQFVRFSRMSDGTYWSCFSPRANTLPFTAGYFAARMGTERFCVVDPVHSIAVFHDKRLAVVRLERTTTHMLIERSDRSPDEAYVRAMWQTFYDATEIDGRRADQRGYDLRTQLMPKRFWKDLPELEPHERNNYDSVPERYASGTSPANPYHTQTHNTQ